MAAVNLWRGHEGRRHTLRVLSVIVIAGALIAPTLALLLGDLDSAGNVAQLVSIPVTLLGLSGTAFTVARSEGAVEGDAPVQAAQTSSESNGSSSARVRPRALTHVPLVLGVVLLAAALTSLLVALPPSFFAKPAKPAPATTPVPDTRDYGDTRQRLTVVSGAAPVSFEGGDLWKWIDLPEGETVVVFSPGGGAKNDGLRAIAGEISKAGACPWGGVHATFTADERRVFKDSPEMSRVTLPDHVDKLVLTIAAQYRKPREISGACRSGLSWRDPGVLRKGAVPKG
jgi:hypothetical protein